MDIKQEDTTIASFIFKKGYEKYAWFTDSFFKIVYTVKDLVRKLSNVCSEYKQLFHVRKVIGILVYRCSQESLGLGSYINNQIIYFV